MPVYRLPDEVAFPDPRRAEPEGLLAVGGDLSPERLLTAYALGIFPWYSEGEPVLWWSPDPRLVLRPGGLRISRRLSRTIRSGRFRLTADRAFNRVMGRCAAKERPGQRGTWITSDMRSAYGELHRLGLAHSVEAWRGEELAGGLYGISLGGTFFGESMFSDVADASKVALAALARALVAWGHDWIDCQVETSHLRTLGAEPLAREAFLTGLEQSLEKPTRRGAWVLPDAEGRP